MLSKDKNIVFFDIDGTLVVRDRLIELRPLKNSIRRWKKTGVVFGIDTNRPWADSAKIYRALGLNGPAIVENGSMYKAKIDSPLKNTSAQLINVKREAAKVLKKFVAANRIAGYRFRIGKNKNALNDKKIGKLILLTPDRKYTASVYVRRKGRSNAALLRQIRSVLTRELNRLYGKRVAVRKMDAGKIVVKNTATDRIKTLSKLRDALYRGYNALLISDEEEITRKPFKKLDFGAVRNSRSEYRSWCRFKTNSAGAKGLLKLIEKFIERK